MLCPIWQRKAKKASRTLVTAQSREMQEPQTKEMQGHLESLLWRNWGSCSPKWQNLTIFLHLAAPSPCLRFWINTKMQLEIKGVDLQRDSLPLPSQDLNKLPNF